jgi:hypothetical protein
MTTTTRTNTTEVVIHDTIYNVPVSYICRLSGEVMACPLKAPSGMIFERSKILAWLENCSETCYITGYPMNDSDLIPDRLLEHKILLWRKNNDVPVGNTTEVVIHDTIYRVPVSYICRLSGEVMDRPLMAPSGMIFERVAILSWLEKGSETCPVTGYPMNDSDLIPDRLLEHMILLWRKNNHVPVGNTTEVVIHDTIYHVPVAYICRISGEVMAHPLKAPSGMIFERSKILAWLENCSETCPVTGYPMNYSDLIPDRLLEHKILLWRKNNDVPAVKGKENINTPQPVDLTNEVSIHGMIYHVPRSYICPITRHVMVQPLLAPSGLNFERAAILSWLEKGSGRCPISREPLLESELIPNRLLEHKTCLWKKNNGLVVSNTGVSVEGEAMKNKKLEIFFR